MKIQEWGKEVHRKSSESSSDGVLKRDREITEGEGAQNNDSSGDQKRREVFPDLLSSEFGNANQKQEGLHEEEIEVRSESKDKEAAPEDGLSFSKRSARSTKRKKQGESEPHWKMRKQGQVKRPLVKAPEKKRAQDGESGETKRGNRFAVQL